jgi:hypothetical protein
VCRAAVRYGCSREWPRLARFPPRDSSANHRLSRIAPKVAYPAIRRAAPLRNGQRRWTTDRNPARLLVGGTRILDRRVTPEDYHHAHVAASAPGAVRSLVLHHLPSLATVGFLVLSLVAGRASEVSGFCVPLCAVRSLDRRVTPEGYHHAHIAASAPGAYLCAPTSRSQVYGCTWRRNSTFTPSLHF